MSALTGPGFEPRQLHFFLKTHPILKSFCFIKTTYFGLAFGSRIRITFQTKHQDTTKSLPKSYKLLNM